MVHTMKWEPPAPELYTCSVCKKPVDVKGEEIKRSCEHDKAVIDLNMSAVMRGVGTVRG